MYERDFDVYMDYFLRFIKFCEEWIGGADIQIAIENTDGFREYEKRAIERMLKSDCFVLTWDIGHSKGIGEIDLIDRLNMAKVCNARCVLETKTIEALKKSVEWIKNDGN